MSKYELAVVVSAKLEDDARAEVIEKVKALVSVVTLLTLTNGERRD